MEQILQDTKQRMGRHVESVQQELARLRTGRASLSMLEEVRVEAYGQQMPLSHVATLNIPEPRLITIQPWDVSVIPAIEKAIQAAQLGLTPANDGKLVRLPIPQLTEERRKESVKTVRKNGEEAKVAVRNTRRDANEEIKSSAKAQSWSEDDVKRLQHEIQKMTDSFSEKIDEVVAHKEKEILTV